MHMRTKISKAAFILITLFLSGCGREDSEELVFQSNCNQEETAELVSTETENRLDTRKEEDIRYPLVATPSDAEWITFVIASEGNYCIFDGEKYGFITEAGEETAPFIYDIAYPFSEGLACVCQYGKYGYIDLKGETAIPFEYDRATPFVEGLAYFASGDTYGFMDKTGKPVFYLECDSISSFQEGLAYFSKGGRYGYIDKKGQVAIEPFFDDAGYFKEGLAKVLKGGRYGVINRDGDYIVAAEYDSITIDDSFIIARCNGKYACFDKTGQSILEQCDHIDVMIKGKYICFVKDGKAGLSDEKGNIFIEPLYDGIGLQSPEQALFLVWKDGLYGVVDLQGEIKIPVAYTRIYYDSYADSIEGGVFLLTDTNGSKECIDTADFSKKIPCNYDSINWLDENRAVVSLDGLSGIIDRKGNLIEPIEYDMIRFFSEGELWLKKGSETWFYNSKGEEVEDLGGYDDISEKGNYYQVEKNGKYGFLNKQGEEVVPPVYSYVSSGDVYGCHENVYILTDYNSDIHNSIIKTGELGRNDISGALLQNEITPKIGLYQEFTQEGNLSVDDEHIHARSQEDLRGYRKTYKLYDLDDSGEPILFFNAEPYEYHNFPESYSGFYAIWDDQLVELFTGYECGGSLRGDYVCLWYDTETSQVLPGKNGVWGGFGGYMNCGTVYDWKAGEVTNIASFERISQAILNYRNEELLEHAELFYDEENNPYTREAIEQVNGRIATKYSVNDVQTTMEEYQEMSDRYQILFYVE